MPICKKLPNVSVTLPASVRYRSGRGILTWSFTSWLHQRQLLGTLSELDEEYNQLLQDQQTH